MNKNEHMDDDFNLNDDVELSDESKSKTKRRGRKDKWESMKMDERLDEVSILAGEYIRDKELYNKLGISHNVFYMWLNEKTGFQEAIDRGREATFESMERPLKKLVFGFKYTNNDIIKERNDDGEMVVIREKIMHRYEKPDMRAWETMMEKLSTGKYKNLRLMEMFERMMETMSVEEKRALTSEDDGDDDEL
jgi:hypothetical protein